MILPRRHVLAGSLSLGLGLLAASQAPAQPFDGMSWVEKKCALYRLAVDDALRIMGRDGLREEFLAANEAFVAGGCTTGGGVCPRTDSENEFASLLTIMTMNEGMASTFVPFGCRD